MSPDEISQIVGDQLEDLRARYLYRERRPVTPLDSTHLEIDGRRYINFASNNYLGLTHHARVIAAGITSLQQSGSGAGKTPLVTGYTPTHATAEKAIATWKGVDDAVLLPSGYQANQAAIQAVAAVAKAAGKAVRFLVDKLVHASLIDALRATGLPFRVFPHNHIAKLERLLQESDSGELQAIVTESIFSMDGDAADLPALVALKQKFGCLLILDEAHASGVYGPDGSGYAAEHGLHESIDLSIVTFSKALGCVGGAVCGSKAWCEAVVNFGRAYIFSTSVPANVAAMICAAIGVLRDEPQRQQRVRLLAIQFRQALMKAGVAILPGDAPIVPIVIGDEAKTIELSGELRKNGLIIPAIRPPTVPRGGSRLRVTVSYDHSDEEMLALSQTLLRLMQRSV